MIEEKKVIINEVSEQLINTKVRVHQPNNKHKVFSLSLTGYMTMDKINDKDDYNNRLRKLRASLKRFIYNNQIDGTKQFYFDFETAELQFNKNNKVNNQFFELSITFFFKNDMPIKNKYVKEKYLYFCLLLDEYLSENSNMKIELLKQKKVRD